MRSFLKIERMWLDGAFGNDELSGDRRIGLAFCHEGKHFPLPRAQCQQCVLIAGRSEEGADNGRVQGRAAAGHPADSVEEVLDVQHPILEQAAERVELILALVAAFPIGFLVRNRLAAFVVYTASHAFVFTFQSISLLVEWAGGSEAAFGPFPEGSTEQVWVTAP